MSRLIESLRIQTFPQPGDFSSTRIEGGAVEIVNKIVEELKKYYSDDRQMRNSSIETDSIVKFCKRFDDETIEVKEASGRKFYTKYLVIAVPPKIVQSSMIFDPPLHPLKSQAMSKSQTWMAGVTKVALVYNSPRFWPLQESNKGLRAGPNKPSFQVYDGSPFEGSLSSLTFFVLSSLSINGDDDELLASQCIEQFCASLSPKSLRENPDILGSLKSYDRFHVKRWPHEMYISDDRDPSRINPHPEPIAELARDEWDGHLLFAGTETDQRSPGVMEGAVGAALRVAQSLNDKWLQ
jgi:monoamine oxidase